MTASEQALRVEIARYAADTLAELGQAAQQAAHARTHGATSATAKWEAVLASLRQAGRRESQVIALAMQQHPELCEQYNAEQRRQR